MRPSVFSIILCFFIIFAITMGNKLAEMTNANVAYVLFWGVISFVSSFSNVLENNWSFVTAEDIDKVWFSPILIWAIAFFGEYIYTIFTMNENTQKLDKKWTIRSYAMIEIILTTLLLGIYVNDEWWRWSSLIILYGSMMILKAASLYVVCPHQRVVSTVPRATN